MSNSSLNFQQVRKKKGVTLKEIAETAGISTTRVYLYDIGASGVSMQDVLKIVHAFNHLTGTAYTPNDFEQPTIIMNRLRRSIEMRETV